MSEAKQKYAKPPGLEPQAWDIGIGRESIIQASIAVSLKRMADMLKSDEDSPEFTYVDTDEAIRILAVINNAWCGPDMSPEEMFSLLGSLGPEMRRALGVRS